MAQNYERQIVAQDTVVVISNTSRIQGGLPNDVATIDTIVQLAQGEAQDLVLGLPSENTDPQTAWLRILDEADRRVEFKLPFKLEDMPPQAQDLLGPLVQEQRQKWETLQRVADAFAVDKLHVKAQDQELKFFQQKLVADRGDGVFEFKILAPLMSFKPANGISIGLVIHLPRGAQLVEEPTVDGGPDGMPVAEQNKVTLAGRLALSWIFRRDPLVTVRYRY